MNGNPAWPDHPYTDPGDGRTECPTCGKFVWAVTHSCKRIPVTEAAMRRHQTRTDELIEASSLGTPDAVAMRERTTPDRARQIVARANGGPCCDMHNIQCEPPGDLCCRLCTEASHDAFPIPHPDGSPCVLPVREDMLDFPTGWRLAREGVSHTDPRCSYVQHDGGFLCDCGAIEAEWARRVAEQQAERADQKETS